MIYKNEAFLYRNDIVVTSANAYFNVCECNIELKASLKECNSSKFMNMNQLTLSLKEPLETTLLLKISPIPKVMHLKSSWKYKYINNDIFLEIPLVDKVNICFINNPCIKYNITALALYKDCLSNELCYFL